METVKWNIFLTAPYHIYNKNYIKADCHYFFIFLQFLNLKYCLQNDRDNLHFCCNCYVYSGTTDLRLRDSTVILAGRCKHLQMYFFYRYSNKCKRFKPISTCVPSYIVPYLCPPGYTVPPEPAGFTVLPVPQVRSATCVARVHSTTCASRYIVPPVLYVPCVIYTPGYSVPPIPKIYCSTCAPR
jgi:hypothetical protein